MKREKINLKVTIAYDGTEFAGFQRQGAGERTVQEELEKALLKLTGENVNLTAAGRTDAGVHARGQVINFHTAGKIPLSRWLPALNSVLPRDVVAWRVEEAPEDFHARYQAKSKIYQYRLLRRPWPDVFRRHYCLHYPYALQVEPMKEAASHLTGYHDFAAFSAIGSGVKTTKRNLLRLEIEEHGDELLFTLEADGFLYKMARMIVGTLLMVGRGKIPPEEVKSILDSRKKGAAGPTAPPHGLCLVRVLYD